MELLKTIWGEGTDLTALQMSCRGACSFILALILIRVSGRRSFGLRAPLDNIIVILLGAVLSRGVVGASPFGPVVATCFVVVLLHRAVSWVKIRHRAFNRIVEGSKIVLYQNGEFVKTNMDRALVCEEDVLQGLRESALTDDLSGIDKIFMERNGEISIVKRS